MRWLCAALIAAAGGAGFGLAAAQPLISHHPAVEPQAAVVAPAYRNVFAETPTGVAQDRVDWKRANAEVGQFTRGHLDLLKWESQHGSAGASPGGAPPTARPEPAPATHGGRP